MYNRFQSISTNQPIHSSSKNSGWIEIASEYKVKRDIITHIAWWLCLNPLYTYRCWLSTTIDKLQKHFSQYCLKIFGWNCPTVSMSDFSTRCGMLPYGWKHFPRTRKRGKTHVISSRLSRLYTGGVWTRSIILRLFNATKLVCWTDSETGLNSSKCIS